MFTIARNEENKPFKVISNKSNSQYIRLYGDNYKRLLTGINRKRSSLLWTNEYTDHTHGWADLKLQR